MFGTAKCGHCGQIGTKIMQIEPNGAAYKQSAICCNSCNAILGVTGYYDTGPLLKKAEKERDELKQRIEGIEHAINQIGYLLQSR